MQDKVLRAFLEGQQRVAAEVNDSSDLVTLYPVDAAPVQTYLAEFRCRTLAMRRSEVITIERCVVALRFPASYLRAFDTAQVFSWVEPHDIWHPNIVFPVICVGQMPPGTPLLSLLHQLFDIITYNNVTMDERDALNRSACAWSRQNVGRFPIDPRPLKWKSGVDREAVSGASQ